MITLKKYKEKVKLKNIILVLLVGAVCACFSSKASYFNWLIMTMIMYIVMNNNFIQTLGTFNISNKYKKRWRIFFYLAIIFIIYFIYTWIKQDGNIRKGSLRFIEYKDSFGYSILLLPVLLSSFSYFRIPINLTFLSIPLFTDGKIVKSMIMLACLDYIISFIVSFIFWRLIYIRFKKILKKKDDYNFWRFIEYISIGILWYCWLNVSVSSFMVFLPPKLDIKSLILFLIIGLVTILIMVILRPKDKMEKIIKEKTDVKNIMSSVLFNILHMIVLLSLKFDSEIPMATSWIFSGLLDGRELGITVRKASGLSDPKYKVCLEKILKDLYLNIVGIFISLLFVRVIKI